jgi:hypothetical protein
VEAADLASPLGVVARSGTPSPPIDLRVLTIGHAQRLGVNCVNQPTIRVWRSGTTCKQPANLAVEGAEESLSIISDYTPTVRPPPKRC